MDLEEYILGLCVWLNRASRNKQDLQQERRAWSYGAIHGHSHCPMWSAPRPGAPRLEALLPLGSRCLRASYDRGSGFQLLCRVCAGVVLAASRSWRGGIAPATGLGRGIESTKISPKL